MSKIEPVGCCVRARLAGPVAADLNTRSPEGYARCLPAHTLYIQGLLKIKDTQRRRTLR